MKAKLTSVALAALLMVGAQALADEPAAPVAATPPEMVSPADSRLKILLLPVDFDVMQFTASGIVEPMPAETTAAEEMLMTAARQVVSSSGRFEIVDMPPLSPEEADSLKEHLALYKLTSVCATQIIQVGGPAWQTKIRDFDYSLGDGLKFLVERSGADAAIVVAGGQLKSSGGRVAMFLLLAAAGVAIPLGGAQVYAGVIDLDTGRIDWMEQLAGTKGDVTSAAGAELTIRGVIGRYPGSRLLRRK
jgi:hypothetical protein